jgi:uncharacterized membrane protein YfcA
MVNIFIATGMGAFIGTQILYLIPSLYVKKIFGFVLLIAMIKLFLSKRAEENKLLKIHDFKVFNTCFSGALISSITGLGGGILFVPLFINLVKLPMRLISPYSNLAMTVATGMGVWPHFFKTNDYDIQYMVIENAFIGNVNPVLILCLFTGAFTFSKLGVRFNNKVDDQVKKKLLGLILLVFSSKILFF